MLHAVKIVRGSKLDRGGAWRATRIIKPLLLALDALAWAARVANQRRALRELDDQQLKDIGLTRADALREAGRGFWDVPSRAMVEGRQGAAAAQPPSTSASPTVLDHYVSRVITPNG